MSAWLIPEWPAPPRVRACTTTRGAGVSQGRYASFNLATHVGDDPQHVSANRAWLRDTFPLPAEPCWLNQVHGRRVVRLDGAHEVQPEADGACTSQPDVVCAVLTADCLPVLLCDRAGRNVAAVHAGWRGLVADVIEAGIEQLAQPAGSLLAWLGPAIGPQSFEVGDDVRDACLAADGGAAVAFTRSGDRWCADLYQLARRRLARRGITRVYGGDYCTWRDARQFYSYRRDGVTGRMATLIWIDGKQ
ncbi:MAG: peptidoglycan editing factor PgeF [Gammaproteobacteria bacterium]|nr:peptidoglycan editing factor PgeF [Gammaproteobacteria bacterium]